MEVPLNRALDIQPCTSVEQPGWLALRSALWPHADAAAHRAEMAMFLADARRFVQFVAYAAPGQSVGFAEASLRYEDVNGTEASPVLFLEGIYVEPGARRRGVARALVEEVERWGRDAGCTEFASDAALDNHVSRASHRALGFEETEQVVYFRKRIA